MLSPKGWITTIAIAGLIILSGMIHYIIYPIVFLVFGSLVSKLNPKNKDNNGRNHIQVLANAGVAGITAILYYITNNPVFIECFVLSFTVALSDTFSSEVGKRLGAEPIDICTLRPITKGLSGGISFIGTLGGVIGSGLIALLYFVVHYDLEKSSIIFIFGFIGMLIDSLLGSTIQAKYQNGEVIKETGNQDQLIHGFHRIDNNWINFLSILICVVLYFIFSSFLS